jgi:hypothetical protein
MGALLQVPRQGERVLRVPLRAEAQRLDAQDELLGGKGVEGGANVAQELDAGADDEGDGAKRLPELEPVVALGRLDELGEPLAVLAPVKLARVDNDAADGRSVAADPFGGRVDNDVGAVVDGADKVAAGTKGVVDLLDYRMSVSGIDAAAAAVAARGIKMRQLTTRGTPLSWATLAMASRSGTLYRGLPMLST